MMKKIKKFVAAIMTSVLLCACGNNTASVSTQAESVQQAESEGNTEAPKPSETPAPTETPVTTPEPAPVVLEKLKFNPHVYIPMLAGIYPKEYWDSLYNLCDALREGKDTFECAGQEIYDWCLDITTLAHLFPAAGGKVSGKSDDGTVPYENGVGRIYYKMPVEDFVKRQADFEKEVENILNSVLESDDTDFEKIFKLYAYIAENYTYTEDFVSDGAFSYSSLMEKKGVCDHIASNYAYLLLQAGIDAVEVGCADKLDHAWNYVKLEGEGYFCDATWALHAKNDPLFLGHFMNSAEVRAANNVPLGNLTMPLLPNVFVNRSDFKVTAESGKFDCFSDAEFYMLDEAGKTIAYRDSEGLHTLKY